MAGMIKRKARQAGALRVSMDATVVSLERAVRDACLARRLEQRLVEQPDVAEVQNWLAIGPRSPDVASELAAALPLWRGAELFDADAAERHAWNLPRVPAVRTN